MKKIYFIIALTFLFSSCNKWLTTSPVDETDKSQMYANTKGFYNVLNGIYLDLGSQELYGKNMTWGAAEAWSRAYILKQNLDAHEAFNSFYDLSYEDKKAKGALSSIWLFSYKNIARSNEFLQSCSKKSDDFFTYDKIEKDLLMGEAYALRAYLHFDLLRIFAQSPSIAGEMDKSYIPYVSEYPSKVNPPIPSKDVLDSIKFDLERAAKLVAGYDTLYKDNVLSANNRFSTSLKPEFGRFYSQRGSRLNYYAIRAIQARVALYEKDYINAVKYSEELYELIKARKLSMVSPSSILANPKMIDEALFAFFNSKLPTYTDSWFDHLSNNVLQVEDSKLFTEISQDQRKNIISYNTITKYNEDKNGSFQNYIPAIKLSEIYYIYAEALAQTNLPQAIIVFNEFLKSRGISSKSYQISEGATLEKFYDYIIDDARKEFVGEGQLIYFYKRLNLPIRTKNGGDNKTIGKLTPPIPDSQNAI